MAFLIKHFEITNNAFFVVVVVEVVFRCYI